LTGLPQEFKSYRAKISIAYADDFITSSCRLTRHIIQKQQILIFV